MPGKISMVELAEIKEKYFVSDIHVRSSDGAIVIYVPTENVSEIAKKGSVSVRQLEHLVDKLSEKYSTKSEIIYTSSDNIERLGEAFKTLIEARFGDNIEEVDFTFFTRNRVNVWLKTNFVDKQKKDEVEKYLNVMLSESEVSSYEVQWVDSIDDFPASIEIIIAIKKLQPVTLDELMAEFYDEYHKINSNWLNRQLDKLIKIRLLVRDSGTKQYSLTGKGLGIIPDNLTKTNSDIVRALALGRKAW